MPPTPSPVIPFTLIGLGIGCRLGQNGAIAVANLVFLALAVLGGLWMPIAVFPEGLETIAWTGRAGTGQVR